MNLELFISSVSVLNAFLNTIALVFIYLKFLKNMRGIFCTLRADEQGTIEVMDR